MTIELGPVRLPKKAEVVARHIAASIVEHGLAPGTVLASEPEMLAQFQVARSTLREALRLLETQGVLSLQAGRSPVVSRPNGAQLLNTLTLLLQFRGGTFETLLRSRALFEPPIAAEAARRARPEQLDALRANITQAKSGVATQHELVHRELEFHRLLAECSGNPLAGLIVAAVVTALANVLGTQHVDHDFAREIRFHEQIVDAVAAGDAAEAEALMRVHIEHVLTSAQQHHRALLQRPVYWM
jgi:DNA-binding FadR family transcriptional regulator